jgi:hypothetical protein
VLPAKLTQQLTAVCSGNTKYAPSTTPAQSYSVQPKPSVSTNLPVTLITGTATPSTFSVTLTNPATGTNWSSLILALKLTFISGQHPTHVTLVNLTVNLDPGVPDLPTGATGINFTDVKINLSPGGTVTAPTAVVMVANDTMTGNWTGLSATVPVTGSPGSQVTVGIASVAFTVGGAHFNCTAGSPAAIIGSILVSGVTLSASPASS